MQCLDYALDKLRTDGGYFVAGRSVHWPVAHAMHSSAPPAEVTHYSPPGHLRQPWHSLMGFHGEVMTGETDPRRPMSRRGIVLSFGIAFVLAMWWAGRSWIRERR